METTTLRPNLAVLISGGGTTLQNFIERIADRRMTATIVGVISSKADAGGIEKAKRAGLPITIVPKGPDQSRLIFEQLRLWKPDLVCLAGWLQLLTIPSDFAGRVLNIHPSLLPAFGGPGMYGPKVHNAVIGSDVKESGCTVHFADQSYDTGPVIGQAKVPVLPGDNATSLAARVFAAECELYPVAIQQVWNRLCESRVG